jgi:hypothetical protein
MAIAATVECFRAGWKRPGGYRVSNSINLESLRHPVGLIAPARQVRPWLQPGTPSDVAADAEAGYGTLR